MARNRANGEYCIFCRQIIYHGQPSGFSKTKSGAVKAWHTECWEKSLRDKSKHSDHVLKEY